MHGLKRQNSLANTVLRLISFPHFCMTSELKGVKFVIPCWEICTENNCKPIGIKEIMFWNKNDSLFETQNGGNIIFACDWMICSLQSRDFASIKACVCRIIMCGIQPLDFDNSVVLLFPFTISLIHQLTDERFSQGELAYNSVLRIIGPCPLSQTNSIQYFKVNWLYSYALLELQSSWTRLVLR